MTDLGVLLTFLAPLAPLLTNPAVSEVMVNAGGRLVFYEVDGRMVLAPSLQIDPAVLVSAIKRIARACGTHVSDAWPLVTARLADGSRVAAVLPPVAVDGACLTIRRFGRRYALQDLVEAGMLSLEHAGVLASAVGRRWNILIVGAAGAGKTTLLNALAALIPLTERVLILEDTAEIHVPHTNLVRFEARPAEEAEDATTPRRAVTLADLLKHALRFRPDRLILGEVRWTEAADLLAAWNTGHVGSFATMHANSADSAAARWRSLVLRGQSNLAVQTVDDDIAAVLHVVVHVELRDGVRRVTDFRLLHDLEPATRRAVEVVPA